MKLGIISDIHENVSLLRQCIAFAAKHQCDELVCLGDMVGFDSRFYQHYLSRSAHETIQMVRSNCRWVVAGNHDLFAAAVIPEYTNGFIFPPNWFNLDPLERKRVGEGKVWCYENEAFNDLTREDLIFLSSLPHYAIAGDENEQVLLSHYIYPDITGSCTAYLTRGHQMKRHWEFMDSMGIRKSFTGHSHRNMVSFAYPNKYSFLKTFHDNPSAEVYLGTDSLVVAFTALSGDLGWNNFATYNTSDSRLSLFTVLPS